MISSDGQMSPRQLLVPEPLGSTPTTSPRLRSTRSWYSRTSTDRSKTDQVDVKVEKGAVTIVAAGDQSYYLGEEVKFSGTNTESYTTYLFIIGPNLAPNGAQINEPRTAVPDNGAGMEQADVASDNTWSYKWGTSHSNLMQEHTRSMR